MSTEQMDSVEGELRASRRARMAQSEHPPRLAVQRDDDAEYNPFPNPHVYFDGDMPTAIEATRAEEPIEDRLHRAWLNGYREGSMRASHGTRWDHS